MTTTTPDVLSAANVLADQASELRAALEHARVNGIEASLLADAERKLETVDVVVNFVRSRENTACNRGEHVICLNADLECRCDCHHGDVR